MVDSTGRPAFLNGHLTVSLDQRTPCDVEMALRYSAHVRQSFWKQHGRASWSRSSDRASALLLLPLLLLAFHTFHSVGDLRALALRATKQMMIPLYSRVHQLQFVAPLNFSENLAEIQPSDIRRGSSLGSLNRTHTPAKVADDGEAYSHALRDKILMALKALHCSGVRLPLRIRVFEPPESNFRMRGYFYVRSKDGNSIEYHRGGSASAPYHARQHIRMNQAMAQVQQVLPELGLCQGIEEALFHVSSKGDVLVMFGYDKILPSSWASKARALHRRFGFHVVGSIIGGSWWARRQGRISVLRDHILEKFDIQGTRLLYRQVC